MRNKYNNGKVVVYGVACPLLDMDTVRCTYYENRQQRVPHCHQLTPSNVPRYGGLSDTCVYRRLHFGKPLPAWHPLLIGNRCVMRQKGIRVNRYSLPASTVPRRHMRRHMIARLPARRRIAGNEESVRRNF